MIKLKPYYRVSISFDAVFLMSEFTVHRLLPEFSSIIEKLINGIATPEDLTFDEVKQLEDLLALKVIYEAPIKNVELCNFLELSGWKEDFVNGQLDNISVEVIDDHPDPYWASNLSKVLEEYDLIKPDPKLHIYVTNLETKLDAVKYPALIVKTGSYISSVGPFLTNQSPLETFNTCLKTLRGGFAEEDFLSDLPGYLRQLQLNLVTHEIMMFLVKIGAHPAATGIVDWNLKLMKRTVWKI